MSDLLIDGFYVRETEVTERLSVCVSVSVGTSQERVSEGRVEAVPPKRVRS